MRTFCRRFATKTARLPTTPIATALIASHTVIVASGRDALRERYVEKTIAALADGVLDERYRGLMLEHLREMIGAVEKVGDSAPCCTSSR